MPPHHHSELTPAFVQSKSVAYRDSVPLRNSALDHLEVTRDVHCSLMDGE